MSKKEQRQTVTKSVFMALIDVGSFFTINKQHKSTDNYLLV